jgi:hypothetical protein
VFLQKLANVMFWLLVLWLHAPCLDLNLITRHPIETYPTCCLPHNPPLHHCRSLLRSCSG